jgi:hypothetical protein
MNRDHLEAVEGISRFSEQLYIERDENGKFKQLYDFEYKPVEPVKMYLSFLIISEMDGFWYKKEWFPYPGFHEIVKKRALGLQRGMTRHHGEREIL